MPTFAFGNVTLIYGPVSGVVQTQQLLVGNVDVSVAISSAFSRVRVGTTIVIPPLVRVVTDNVFDMIKAASTTGIDPFVCGSAADKLFGAFGGMWLSLARKGFQLASTELWKMVLDWTATYELVNNLHIHKGTPLFFRGGSLLTQGDVDAGFSYVYDAMEEDKALATSIGRPARFKESPAYKTARIVNSNQNALYILVVVPCRLSIRRFIRSFGRNYPSYTTSMGTPLTMKVFESEFLSKPSLEQVIFFFVYNLYRHVRRSRFGKNSKNDFMKLSNANTFFNMGLIIEQVLKERFPTGTKHYIADGICQLAGARGWIPPGEDKYQFIRKLSGVHPRQDPSSVIPTLIAGNPLYNNRPMREEMKCLLLAWHLRNHAGHNVQAQDLFVSQYETLFRWLIFALFISVV
jgi:hypothetical protein